MTSDILPGIVNPIAQVIDTECESVHSDYSELAAPLRELDLLGSLRRDSLRKSPSPSDINVETEEEYAKRMKKVNILSLAQEFADLKQIDSNALPFDIHKTLENYSLDSDSSSLNTDTDSLTSPDTSIATLSEIADVYNIEQGNRYIDKTVCPVNVSNGKTNDSVIANSFDSRDLSDVSDNADNQILIDPSSESQKTMPLKQSGLPRNMVSSSNSNLQNNIPRNLVPNDRPYIAELTIVSSGNTKEDLTTPNPSDNTQNCNINNGNEYSQHNSDRNPKQCDLPKNFARITKDTLPPKNYDAVLTGHDFDVYNIETALPEMDWSLFESRIQKASEMDKKYSEARNNNREEIRKKLAMGTDDDVYDSEPVSLRKPSLTSRIQGAKNLQICFMNDVDDGSDPEPLISFKDPDPPPSHTQMNGKLPCKPLANEIKPVKSSQPVNQSTDFLQQQVVLQEEAKLALAQAGTMARMQLEVEKQSSKRSPIAEKVGIPDTLVENKQQKLTWRVLQMMNIAQVQVAVNDLHTQIEVLNDELVRLLIERDDLHMEQDSMLVDIEDHTRRAKEVSERLKTNQKQKKPGRRK